jgi:hypothetical protein
MRVAVGMVVVCLASLALADPSTVAPPAPPPPPLPPPPAQRLPPTVIYDNVFIGRINPLGVADELRVRFRMGLYGHPHLALSDNFFGVVGSMFLTPSQIRPGIGVELQPLSVLHFYVGYEPIIHFGDLGALHSYNSPNADFGSDAFATSPPYGPGDTYAATVHQVMLSMLFQMAIKWFAFRSMLRGTYINAGLRPGDTVFYDPIYDILLPREGWMLHNETDALYRSKFGLIVGIRLAITTTWYPATAFLPGESTQNNNVPIIKLGPLVAYTFFEKRYKRFDAPTLFLSLGWYLMHRYRTGELVNQGVPQIIIGFAFKGTFLGGMK